MADLKRFEELITEFNKLPRMKSIPKTFFEVSGYPHYENVCSNILAFFLESTEQHGMNDLFVKSLLEAAGETRPLLSGIETSAYTEVSTENGRIDILVESDEVDIVIENKIYAGLQNDLDDYYKAVQDKQSNDKKIIVPIVLSLDPNMEVKQVHWKPITYGQFFDKVKQNLGDYVCGANAEWVIFLTNFMRTIQNLGGINMSDEQYAGIVNFFSENMETIRKVEEERENLTEHYARKAEQVAARLKERCNFSGRTYKNPKSYYAATKHKLVGNSDKYGYELEVVCCLEGWEIRLVMRKIGEKDEIVNLLREKNILAKTVNAIAPEPESAKGYFLPLWNLVSKTPETTMDEIVENATRIFEILMQG